MCQSSSWPKVMFVLGMYVVYQICGLVRSCFWWEVAEVHKGHGNGIGFSCQWFAAFYSHTCPLKKSLQLYPRSDPFPSYLCFKAYEVYHLLFLFYSSIPALVNSASVKSCKQFMGKINKKRLIAVLVSLSVDYSNRLPFVLAVWELLNADLTGWVRNLLWGGCSRMALNIWVSHPGVTLEKSLISFSCCYGDLCYVNISSDGHPWAIPVSLDKN